MTMPATDPGPLLELRGLRMHFPVTEGMIARRHVGDVKAVDGVDLTISRGETLGLVGESGCGKTTMGRCILRLEKPTAGEILYDGIDIALVLNPESIVCEESVSALDVSIQAQIINLLEDLRDKFNLTYLFIAHDLSVVRHLCQRVAVMYLGRVVELAECDEVFDHPLHPYTRALLAAVPVPDPTVEATRAFQPVQGEVPSPINPPPGCVFHPRCGLAVAECRVTRPELRELRPGHWVACSQVQ